VLSKALFVENVEPCASDVGVEDLASLSDALRGCVEFGVDFQRATGVRQRLRHCFGSDFGLRSVSFFFELPLFPCYSQVFTNDVG